ncbi:hypothetical protein RMONA_04060 [Rickettsia monacensis]|uniref:Uncharacterized protein n=1 Tax=Rickettsia monacensis TaxID=109232 RepID=A0A0B7J436_9RICK|nr:hypothetical protein RMONA_3625 [Rickettsia monacensis IrR/Munich]CEO17198.1 hypothetical protein RMONA_04060 [Rickettsia monacensis]
MVLKLYPLEIWILYHAPSIKATQERFKIFQKILQDKLEDGMQFISVPCGTMDDLLTLTPIMDKE